MTNIKKSTSSNSVVDFTLPIAMIYMQSDEFMLYRIGESCQVKSIAHMQLLT